MEKVIDYLLMVRLNPADITTFNDCLLEFFFVLFHRFIDIHASCLLLISRVNFLKNSAIRAHENLHEKLRINRKACLPSLSTKVQNILFQFMTKRKTKRSEETLTEYLCVHMQFAHSCASLVPITVAFNFPLFYDL